MFTIATKNLIYSVSDLIFTAQHCNMLSYVRNNMLHALTKLYSIDTYMYIWLEVHWGLYGISFNMTSTNTEPYTCCTDCKIILTYCLASNVLVIHMYVTNCMWYKHCTFLLHPLRLNDTKYFPLVFIMGSPFLFWGCMSLQAHNGKNVNLSVLILILYFSRIKFF